MKCKVTAPMGVTIKEGAMVKLPEEIAPRFEGHVKKHGQYLRVTRPFMLKIGTEFEMKDVPKDLTATGKLEDIDPPKAAPAKGVGDNAGRNSG